MGGAARPIPGGPYGASGPEPERDNLASEASRPSNVWPEWAQPSQAEEAGVRRVSPFLASGAAGVAGWRAGAQGRREAEAVESCMREEPNVVMNGLKGVRRTIGEHVGEQGHPR